jgi:uncharacterized membrane protein
LKALTDVLFLSAFSSSWQRLSSFACRFLVSEFAFLCRVSSVISGASDVVDLEGVILFSVFHFLSVSVSSTFSKRSAGSGIS